MFTDAAVVKTFTQAGKGYLTLRSKRTMNRFTYNVRRVQNAPHKFFVGLLTGSDNETSYSYLGLLIGSNTKFQFNTTRKSCATPSAPSAKAFSYFVHQVMNNSVLPETLEVFHDGKCGRCRRLLTTPESVQRGIGPECAKHMGLSCD